MKTEQNSFQTNNFPLDINIGISCRKSGSRVYKSKLVYLNGNNATEGENNIKYANSYPMK